MRRALCVLLLMLLLSGCQRTAAMAAGVTGGMELKYAQNFAVDYYDGGAARLRVAEQDFLLLPEGAAVPDGLESIKQIPIPVEKVYLASSSVPDLFIRMGALDKLAYVSASPENWNLPELREALGLPVLVEYSSYEPHPLGRVEWIKLYGLLTGRLAEAEAFFRQQEDVFRAVEETAPTGKRAAFFHLSANGGVTVRRRADYVTRMIELAGGETAITDLPASDSALSTETIQMESFYAQARDADVLIYNSTAAVEVGDMEQFLALSPLLTDFKAVREGNVWCTDKSMFQRSSAAADVIRELHGIFSGEDGDYRYFYRLG